jgi:hypothetical protein
VKIIENWVIFNTKYSIKMYILCEIALQYMFKHKPQYNITRTQNLHKEINKMKYITNEQEYIFETFSESFKFWPCELVPNF